MRSAFTTATLQEFGLFGAKRTLFAVRHSAWAVVKKSKVVSRRNIGQRVQLDCVDIAIRIFLLELVGPQQARVSTVELVDRFRTAILCTLTNPDPTVSLESQIQSNSFKRYNAISPGEAVQVLCSLSGQALQEFLNRDGIQILPPAPGTEPPSFWMITDLYKVRSSPFVYARVIPLVREGGEQGDDRSDVGLYVASCPRAKILLQLSTGCRKALLLHSCSESIDKPCSNEGVISATQADAASSCLQTHRWAILGSRDGFPPRSG